MYRFSILFIVLAVFSSEYLASQVLEVNSSSLPGDVQFGSINDSLFTGTSNHGAPFEYLLKKTDVHFINAENGITAVLDTHVRLRIFSDNPLDIAEASLVGIPFYVEGNIEQVDQIEAITYQPDGTQTHFNPENLSNVELNSRYNIIEFRVPDVQQGSIIEYRYQLRRRYIEELPDFYFSHRVPTRLAHITIHYSDFIRYEAVPDNINFAYNFVNVQQDTSRIPLLISGRFSEPIVTQHWFARDIPAVQEPAYISTVDDLRGKLKFQISEFGRPRQPLENSWDYVAAQIRRGENNPFQLIDTLPELQSLGRTIAAEVSSPRERVDSLFYYVNSRVVFNGDRGVFPAENLDGILEGSPAGQPEINTVLLALLRGAGVDAWPVYLSGRSTGRINMAFPSLFQFNQMLIFADDASGGRLIDASYPGSKPGLIPVESYNQNGMLFRPDGYEWINIRPEYSLFDISLTVDGELSAEGDFRGKISAVADGYPAQQIGRELHGGKAVSEVVKEAFFDAYPDVFIEQAEISPGGKYGYPVHIEADFLLSQYASTFQEGLQFRPMVVGYLNRNPFDESSRDAPITLDAPERLDIRYRILLPDNLRVEELQERNTTRAPGAILNESYDVQNGEIRYDFSVNIERHEFSADEYGQLKNLYDRWVFLSGEEWFIENE